MLRVLTLAKCLILHAYPLLLPFWSKNWGKPIPHSITYCYNQSQIVSALLTSYRRSLCARVYAPARAYTSSQLYQPKVSVNVVAK